MRSEQAYEEIAMTPPKPRMPMNDDDDDDHDEERDDHHDRHGDEMNNQHPHGRIKARMTLNPLITPPKEAGQISCMERKMTAITTTSMPTMTLSSLSP